MEGGGGGEVEGGEEVGEGFSAADLDDGAIGTQEELSGAALTEVRDRVLGLFGLSFWREQPAQVNRRCAQPKPKAGPIDPAPREERINATLSLTLANGCKKMIQKAIFFLIAISYSAYLSV